VSALLAVGIASIVAASFTIARAGVGTARRRQAVDHAMPRRHPRVTRPAFGPTRRLTGRLTDVLAGHQRRAERDDLEIADLSEGLAAALRRGATLPEALTELGLARSELDPTSTDPHRRILSLGVIVGGQVGGSVAGVFDSVAASVRDQCDQRRAARIATASARTSASVITALPVIVVSLLSLDGRFRHSSFATLAGLSAMAGATVLEVIGWSWMRRLLRSVG